MHKGRHWGRKILKQNKSLVEFDGRGQVIACVRVCHLQSIDPTVLHVIVNKSINQAEIMANRKH
jgi:hypothetical protein